MAWVEKHGAGYRACWRDHKGRTRTRSGFSHKPAARSFAEDAEDKARRGDDPDAGRTLFRVWAARVMAARVVEATTAAGDKSRYDAILAEWGDWPVERIRTIDVQGWVRRLSSENRAAATVRQYHSLMSLIMGAAVVERMIPENPCKHVVRPPAPPGRELFLTREEAAALLAKLDELAEVKAKETGAGADRVHRVITHTLLGTGMRWGELAGFHVNRFSALRRQIEIIETVVEPKPSERELKAYPKGAKTRVIPITQELVEDLAAHLAAHPPRPCGLEHPGKRKCPGLVFSAVRGGPLSRGHWLRDNLRPAIVAAGLNPELRAHDLRHSYASWLAQSGVPMREVQRLLGHASIVTTERVYAHFSAEPDARIVTALSLGADLVARSSEPDRARRNFT